jgi:hypothetical protein
MWRASLSRCGLRCSNTSACSRASFSSLSKASQNASLTSKRRALAVAVRRSPQSRSYASASEEPKGAGGEGVVSYHLHVYMQ